MTNIGASAKERSILLIVRTGVLWVAAVMVLSIAPEAKADDWSPEKIAEYRAAAAKGEAWAQSNLGIAYAEGMGVPEDDAAAAKLYTRAAEQGDAQAQSNLGNMYDNGNGVSENDATAAKWYTKAAEQGNVDAQYNLGNLYRFGDGVAQNDATALKWYTKAAEQGAAGAQLNLGLMYAKGEGVPENNMPAYMWINLAAAQGHEYAKTLKDRIKDGMTPADISKAQALSRECLAKSYKNCG
jgi:TPR repeat protein